MKAAFERACDLEERLAVIRRALSPHAYDGLRLSARDVRDLIEEIEDCRHEAGLQRNELSRRRWNARSAADPLAEIVVAEAGRAGTNLVLFPVAARPLPADAIQREERP